MEWIDIFLIAISAYALYRGYKNGVIVELAGVIGIVVGGFVAYHYNDMVVRELKLSFPFAEQISFIGVILAIVVVLAVAARLISKVLNKSGLGTVNSLLGAAVSLFKVMLVMSLLLTAFDAINRTANIVDQSTLDRSKGYKPTIKMAEIFFPYMDFVYDYLDIVKDQIEDGVESATDKIMEI